MGRSNGYRPKAAVREEVLALRARLSLLDSSQWQKASMIMDQITTLLGHTGGPMGAKIEPRACRCCHYYGHTRQHCPRIKRMEEEAADRLLREDEQYFAMCAQIEPPPPYDPLQCPQARTFDANRMPFTVDPDLGPLVGERGGTHHGQWTFAPDGAVVARV